MEDLRVVNHGLTNTVCGINNTQVHFDENGVSEVLSPADFATACSIPSFIPLGNYLNTLAAQELDAFLGQSEGSFQEQALPVEGEAPEVDPALGQDESDDSGQEIPEHDEDATLYERFQAQANRLDWFAALPLVQRLDLASDHRLTEVEASEMFTWEDCGKKSKRVLTALDSRLQLLRQSKSAVSVTNDLIKANFPVQEEQ